MNKIFIVKVIESDIAINQNYDPDDGYEEEEENYIEENSIALVWNIRNQGKITIHNEQLHNCSGYLNGRFYDQLYFEATEKL